MGAESLFFLFLGHRCLTSGSVALEPNALKNPYIPEVQGTVPTTRPLQVLLLTLQ